MLTKEQNREFLRICKKCGFIKFNKYLADTNITQSNFSKFLNKNDYIDCLTTDKVNDLAEKIYNSCEFIADIYKEFKKIA